MDTELLSLGDVVDERNQYKRDYQLALIENDTPTAKEAKLNQQRTQAILFGVTFGSSPKALNQLFGVK